MKKMVHGTRGIPSWDPRKEKLLRTQEESEGREEGSLQDQKKPKTEKKEEENGESKVQGVVNLCVISMFMLNLTVR